MSDKWRPANWKNPHPGGECWLYDITNAERAAYEAGADAMLKARLKVEADLAAERAVFRMGMEAIQAENARLREALEKIAKGGTHTCFDCDGDGAICPDPEYPHMQIPCSNCGDTGQVPDDAQEIARQALEGL